MNFLIVSLAIWRLTSLLVNEDGPFAIFERLRHVIGVRWDENSEQIGTNVIAEAFTCVRCCSVWASGIGALMLSSSVLEWALNTLALSTVAIIIEEVVND